MPVSQSFWPLLPTMESRISKGQAVEVWFWGYARQEGKTGTLDGSRVWGHELTKRHPGTAARWCICLRRSLAPEPACGVSSKEKHPEEELGLDQEDWWLEPCSMGVRGCSQPD